jgi:uncharacterized damage-inducible protein DinB
MSALPNAIVTSQAEREMLLDLLRESQERFLASFANVSDVESRRCPAQGAWSVLETVEHIVAAETTMLKLVTTSRRPRPADAPNREQIFVQVLTDRSRKSEAPEPGRPRGRFASLEEAVAEFKKTREGVRQFVVNTQEDLRATGVTHPHPAAGNVSCFEMIIIIAKHAERHALQMEEIKNSPAFRATAKGRG